MNERMWIDIEPGNSSLCERDFEGGNPSSSTLSNSTTRRRRSSSGGGAKRRYQYCTDVSGIIVHFRALQGHSGRNLVDPSLQDNVEIQSGFF